MKTKTLEAGILSKVFEERISTSSAGALVRFTAVQNGYGSVCTRWMVETPQLRCCLPDTHEFNLAPDPKLSPEAETVNFIGNYMID